MEQRLKLMVRTPREVVLELDISSLRVPTESGQVGLRPRVEAQVLAVEPGLVLVRQDGSFRFIGTAGGLLRCDGEQANLLTPLAVVGTDEDDLLAVLEHALAQPNIELEVRAILNRLQSNILRELRRGSQDTLRLRGEVN
jgi:F0F1-type ATP synthase epsilon subunit